MYVIDLCHVLQRDPLRPLKDLAELKDQLEDIQRRVEKEVQAGIPQVRCLTHTQASGCFHANMTSYKPSLFCSCYRSGLYMCR